MHFSKRALDIAASALGLVVLSPLLILVCAWVWIDAGLPIFFFQKRVGRRGRPFQLVKFRTMARAPGMLLTVGADPRITRSGHWLRRTKLDELPQLWNVLKGEMSLVGPRPEVAKYVALYTEEQRAILEFTPGITDPASLEFGNESELMAGATDPEQLYIREILPRKLALSLDYARRAGLGSDLGIIMKTVIFQGKQAKHRPT
jgi:lipopolysaccharide/colanic/teichoic acid biosynthesis glycosyltransferase